MGQVAATQSSKQTQPDRQQYRGVRWEGRSASQAILSIAPTLTSVINPLVPPPLRRRQGVR